MPQKSTTHNLQPTTYNLQLTTYNRQPTTDNRQPTTYNLQPTTYNILKKTIVTKRKKRIKEGKVKLHILKNRLKPCGFSSKISISLPANSIFEKKDDFIKMLHLKNGFLFFSFFSFGNFNGREFTVLQKFYG